MYFRRIHKAPFKIKTWQWPKTPEGSIGTLLQNLGQVHPHMGPDWVIHPAYNPSVNLLEDPQQFVRRAACSISGRTVFRVVRVYRSDGAGFWNSDRNFTMIAIRKSLEPKLTIADTEAGMSQKEKERFTEQKKEQEQFREASGRPKDQ